MNDKKESWFIKFLQYVGIVKTYEIGKSEMCKKAQSVCSCECDSCAWYENRRN